MKPNKQIYIDFIISQIESGLIAYKDVYNVFLPKFATTRQTFDKYWKLANQAYSERREAINKAKEQEAIEAEKEATKRLYLSRAERMEIAFKIAMGKYRSVGGELFVPTDSDRLKALDYLAKMDGDYKPAKTAQTDSEGNDIPFIEQLIIAAKGVKRKQEVEN